MRYSLVTIAQGGHAGELNTGGSGAPQFGCSAPPGAIVGVASGGGTKMSDQKEQLKVSPGGDSRDQDGRKAQQDVGRGLVLIGLAVLVSALGCRSDIDHHFFDHPYESVEVTA